MSIQSQLTIFGDFSSQFGGDRIEANWVTNEFFKITSGSEKQKLNTNWYRAHQLVVVTDETFGETAENLIKEIDAKSLRNKFKVNALIELSLDNLLKIESQPQRSVLRYIITEQNRVQKALEAMADGKPLIFGNLLDQSEYSAESQICSCAEPELHQICLNLAQLRGVLGVRRCHLEDQKLGIIALVDSSRLNQIDAAISKMLPAASMHYCPQRAAF